MKKYLFIFFILLASSSFDAIGQSSLTEQEVKTMLCHKWQAMTMEIQGEKISADEDLYITFLKNGTFIDSQEGNNEPNEKWTYTHSTMTITTGGIIKKILKIDDKQLKLRTKMEGQNTIVTLKRVD